MPKFLIEKSIVSFIKERYFYYNRFLPACYNNYNDVAVPKLYLKKDFDTAQN